jgi:hypothetical protein
MGTIAAGKAGIRQFLQATEGLRDTDGVTVRSTGNPLPAEMTTAMILLGSATIAYEQAGLAGRAETPTVSCWAVAVKPGSGEDALDAARDAAEALYSLASDALASDPTAASSVPPPGRITVVAGGLEESPVDWDGAAAYRVDRAFSISWTSHIT